MIGHDERAIGGHTPWWLKGLILVLAALAALSAGQGCRTALSPGGSLDFGLTLKAAEILLHANPYRADIGRALAQVAAGPASGLAPDVNPYPAIALQAPSVLALLWPLVPLSWPAARLVWLIANLGFTAGTLALACRRYLPDRSRWTYAALASLLLISFPWRVVIGNGQHVMAALFFFLLAAELADRGHRAWAGVALAASFVKYSVSLFLLPLLVAKRQCGPLVVAITIHGLATLAIAVRLHENPLALLGQALAASRTQLPSGYVDLFALAHAVGLPALVAGVTAAALAAASVGVAAARRLPEPALLTLLCLLSLVAVYHRLYDLVVLVIPLIILAGTLRDRWLQALIGTAIALGWFASRLLLWLPWPMAIPLNRLGVGVTIYAALFALFVRSVRDQASSGNSPRKMPPA
ncbi:MAG: glycosyltransferase 87 family protein [Sphingomicrobium sp.]